jgi:hypothetical protein
LRELHIDLNDPTRVRSGVPSLAGP